MTSTLFFVNRLDQRMPLMHPRTAPKQPRRDGGNDHYHIGNVGIVLRYTSGEAGGEDETQEDDAQD